MRSVSPCAEILVMADCQDEATVPWGSPGGQGTLECCMSLKKIQEHERAGGCERRENRRQRTIKSEHGSLLRWELARSPLQATCRTPRATSAPLRRRVLDQRGAGSDLIQAKR